MTEIKTLYNAECPICNFEISHYATYAADHGLPMRFDDLNTADLAQWGLSPDQALRRLYVVHDGQMLSGIPAFLVLWQNMPRYRWVARIVGLPVLKQIASALYDYVAAPVIYRWAKRRAARQARSA